MNLDNELFIVFNECDKIKGLDVYSSHPYKFLISEDRKVFYYSEVGILISAKFYDKNYADPQYIEDNFLNPNWSTPRANKYAIDIQYDYRDPKDLNNYNYCNNTGTRSTSIFFETIEDSVKGIFDFLNSKFKEGSNATFRDVALKQSLHHTARFIKYNKSYSLAEDIILKSKHSDLYKQIIENYKNRDLAEKKYLSKLSAKFESVFKKPLIDFVYPSCKFDLSRFLIFIKQDLKSVKNNPDIKLIKSVIKYYN